VSFSLLGSLCVKVAHKTLVKSTPDQLVELNTRLSLGGYGKVDIGTIFQSNMSISNIFL